ncbi:glycerophosphodiester phosphodiesterase family protein [Kocuria sp.]|uniref:glycerophosphodiester phosphodiesterase family protein n=1 Tax=Kocuria sp. TaxID=1871328 RepID=UPI0026DEDBDA|nr:glycerophosphodiester phosphodiesterase family protein [Kocuria sp.]MDO5367280.1 glycerophosphodiester phosphodiesterase family protein [Kocuria sp.]
MSVADQPAALAHRGFSLDGHENTLRAFRAAADLGFVWVETDVNTTSDGVVLAFHDPTLDRVTNTSGDVCDLPWSELQDVRIGSTEPLATLSELLRELPDLHFNIDVKDESSVTALPRVLAQEGAVDRVRVTSFSEDRRRRTLENIARLTGKRPLTSAGTIGCAGLTILSKTARVTDKASPRIASLIWSLLTKAWAVKVADFTAVQLPVTYDLSLPGGRKLPVSVVDPKFVEVAHRVGVAVHVWTINDADEMRQLLDIGADGIVTDRGDVLTRVLADRGQWPPHSA